MTAAERRISVRPTRRQVLTTLTLTTANLAAGGLLSGCSDPGPPRRPAARTTASPTPGPTPGTGPTPSAPPAGLATLTMPVAYTSIPISDGNRQPPMVVLMRPSEFYAPDPRPLWTFSGDSDWLTINGFKFRRLGSRTVALVACAQGQLAIVPVAPAAGTAPAHPTSVGPHDAIWQTRTRASENPHAVELIPAGEHVWPGGRGTAPDLVAVAAPGDGGSLTIHDLRSGSRWRTPFPLAHGVLWDPAAQRLWTVGQNGLSSYRIQRYDSHRGTAKTIEGEILSHAGSGWGLADERFESDAPRDGHDLQPDYSSNGSYLLITSPSETVRLPRADPTRLTRLDLPADPGEPGTPGIQQLKSAVRSPSGLYLWIRMQGHDVNTDAHWTDTAISVGRAVADTDGTQQVGRVTTLDLPPGNWTYKVRLLMTGYS